MRSARDVWNAVRNGDDAMRYATTATTATTAATMRRGMFLDMDSITKPFCPSLSRLHGINGKRM